MASQFQTAGGETPLCANNCGFFGNSNTSNLCSKCYKSFITKQSEDMISTTINESDERNSGKIEIGNSSMEIGSSEKQHPNRCSSCRKRVGLTGFKCRCGQTFCSMHRYSDEHSCVFDYKTAAQDAIARANPVVKSDKVEKI